MGSARVRSSLYRLARMRLRWGPALARMQQMHADVNACVRSSSETCTDSRGTYGAIGVSQSLSSAFVLPSLGLCLGHGSASLPRMQADRLHNIQLRALVMQAVAPLMLEPCQCEPASAGVLGQSGELFV